jgi:hypothetical protein
MFTSLIQKLKCLAKRFPHITFNYLVTVYWTVKTASNLVHLITFFSFRKYKKVSSKAEEYGGWSNTGIPDFAQN